MSQQWLNNLLLLHVHKNGTDALNLAEVGNEFVSIREPRLRMFGNSSEIIIIFFVCVCLCARERELYS